jgi:hypothetical protein
MNAAAQSWVSREERIVDLLGPAPHLVAAAQAAATRADAEPTPGLPASVVDWLTQLTLLYGVPFEYLVADPRLLPPESLRFFYLDRNWLDRLVDGALSVATLSTAEAIFNEAFFTAVYAVIEESQQALRAAMRGETPSATVGTGGTYSGLLMRSVVVSGWPGLEVAATKGGQPVALLRMDRLSDSVLLILFEDVPDTVNIIEPGEGLHFGVFQDPHDATRYDVNLRGLGFAGHAAGVQLVGSTAGTTMRSGPNQPGGVLDIAALRQDIAAKLPDGALGPGNALTAGGFALQLVRGAGLQSYNLTAPPGPPAAAARRRSIRAG